MPRCPPASDALRHDRVDRALGEAPGLRDGGRGADHDRPGPAQAREPVRGRNAEREAEDRHALGVEDVELVVERHVVGRQRVRPLMGHQVHGERTIRELAQFTDLLAEGVRVGVAGRQTAERPAPRHLRHQRGACRTPPSAPGSARSRCPAGRTALSAASSCAANYPRMGRAGEARRGCRTSRTGKVPRGGSGHSAGAAPRSHHEWRHTCSRYPAVRRWPAPRWAGSAKVYDLADGDGGTSGARA